MYNYHRESIDKVTYPFWFGECNHLDHSVLVHNVILDDLQVLCAYVAGRTLLVLHVLHDLSAEMLVLYLPVIMFYILLFYQHDLQLCVSIAI